LITLEMLTRVVSGVAPEDVQRWIDNALIRPEGTPGHYVFHDIDVARVRLIKELRTEMSVGDEMLPMVLSLLDQLYQARRTMLLLRDAIGAAPEEVRQHLMSVLERHGNLP
jgi:chaperone modulatory protein CbpM